MLARHTMLRKQRAGAWPGRVPTGWCPGPGHQEYLINKYKPAHRLKIVPTQADRPAYEACLDATPQAGGTDRVGAAYRFFVAQLAAIDDTDDPLDIERIEDAVISGMALVSVVAQAGDNVYRIFES